jgi:hypothetical protein
MAAGGDYLICRSKQYIVVRLLPNYFCISCHVIYEKYKLYIIIAALSGKHLHIIVDLRQSAILSSIAILLCRIFLQK